MSKPEVTVSFEPEEKGKLVYLAGAPMGAGQASSSLLSFKLIVRNNGGTTERLNKITVALLPAPGQPGNPQPLVFSFNREPAIEIAPGKTKQTQISKDEKITIPTFAVLHAQIGLFFAEHDQPVTTTRQLAKHKSPTPQESYRFFGNTRDMGFDEYFFQSRHTDAGQFFEYDMKVCGWNEEKGEFRSIKSGTSGDHNEDYFGFGKPLYALADGKVISFANDRDENPIPGERALIRLADKEAGAITAFSLTRLSNQRMATAVRTKDGKLKIIIWETVIDGNKVTECELVRLGDVDGEAISDIASAALSASRLVTAARTATGLKIAVWDTSADGKTVTRLGETEAGAVGQMAITNLTGKRIAVGAQTAEGNLKVIVWDVSADGLTLTRAGESEAGAIKKVDIAAINSTRLVTAVRTSGDRLKVIVWDAADNGTVTRRGDSEGDSVSDVGLTLVNSGRGRVVTAVRTTANKLKLTVWEANSNGNVARVDDLEAGAISSVKIAGPTNEKDDLATCVITNTGVLKVNTWKSADQNDESKVGLIRYSNSGAGAIDLLDIAWLKSDETPNLIVTAVRTGGGNLKLITWWLAGGGGNHVYLLHGDELVYFAHMMKGSLNPAVCKLGASVKQGQFVGRMGNSGAAGGPHCHIEASQAPAGMTVEQMIEEHQKGTLAAKLVYRPMPFHNAQAMRLSDLKPGLLADNKFAVVNDQGFYWEAMAIWPGLTSPGIPTDRPEMAFHGVRSADYQTLFERLTGAGYRLGWIDGYAIANDLRFNVLFKPNDNSIGPAHHNLTGKQYQDAVDEQKANGRRLIHVNSYRSGNQTLYAAIFRKTDGAFPVAYHDLPTKEHDARFESLKGDGFAPINVSVVSINGQRRYTAFYDKRDVGGFVLKSFLTAEAYQNEVDSHKDDGLRIAYLDAYQHNDEVRFSAVWNREHEASQHARHHLTAAQYQQEYNTTTGKGFLTAAVVGYALGNQPRFAGVWRK